MPIELSDMQCDILYSFMDRSKTHFYEQWVALSIIMEQAKLRRNMTNKELMEFKEKIQK